MQVTEAQMMLDLVSDDVQITAIYKIDHQA
jgi:hypothetical protein